ncbi:MAG: hypothetical protein ACI8ZM_003803 [Crocinitomix sp.]|jgi:hypothetical protein
MFLNRKEPTFKIIKMKTKNILKSAIILLGIMFAFPAESQTVSHNVVTSAAPGTHEYSIQGLVNSRATSFYSYLWWFGDNGFSFNEKLVYTHYNPDSKLSFNTLGVTTENYGTGGPPPIQEIVTGYPNSGVPMDVLPHGVSLYVQNFRNAVPNEFMYLIITYQNIGNPYVTKSGSIYLELDQHLAFDHTFDVSNPEVYPNGEQFVSDNGGQVEWSFIDLEFGEERSILIRILVSEKASETVSIATYLETVGLNGEGMSDTSQYSHQLPAIVELSHDPNMMSEQSDEQRLCSVKQDTISYTVNFQNIGKAPTEYVKVICHLDDKVDFNSISNIKFPKIYESIGYNETALNGYDNGDATTWARCFIDSDNRTISFEMNQLILRSLNDPSCLDLEATRSEVSFTINVKPDYVFGPDVKAHSEIFFDGNHPIVTNDVYSGCKNAIEVNNGGGFQTAELPVSNCCSICCYVIVGLLIILLLLVLMVYLRLRKRGA